MCPFTFKTIRQQPKSTKIPGSRLDEGAKAPILLPFLYIIFQSTLQGSRVHQITLLKNFPQVKCTIDL